MFYYSILPSGVMYDTNLSDASKILYAVILSLANNRGLCDASNEYLGELTHKSERAIKYQIAQLLDRGYIKVDYKQFKRRLIYPVWTIKPTTLKKAMNIYTKFMDDNIREEADHAIDTIFKAIK